MKIGQSAGKSYAYILGVYLGDGCVTRSGNKYLVFRLNTIDEDFAEATKKALLDITDNPVSYHKHDVKKSKNPNYSLYCYDQDLCRYLRTETDNKEIIPKYVKKWSKDKKLHFISGVMDSEGFVAANSNPTNRRYYMGYKSCDIWVADFIEILQSVGIKIGKVSQEKPRKSHYKTPTRFHIKMQSWIDSGAKFNISRKQNRVNEWASFGPYEKRRLTSTTNTPDTEKVMIESELAGNC